MSGFGIPELLIILGILVLLFGARWLPRLARSWGAAIKEVRRTAKEGKDGGAAGEGRPD